jgi:hypothetical protein
MGEVIHGEYNRWVNDGALHSVTNYALHKALYSGHNDHNYFEIAHTIKRQRDMGLGDNARLYDFVDNHDVERIMTKLRDKRHFLPVHVLLYTLPGIPSVYYGSEFGIEGRKERGSDASLRPALSLVELSAYDNIPLQIISALGNIYSKESALWYGEYREIDLTTVDFFCPVSAHFFDAYEEAFPKEDGFSERADLWKINQWLGHVTLYGDKYK